jgi:large subunit ribosomal protein L22
MAVIAKLKYLRMAPRKVRLVVDLVRGKKAKEAENILSFTTKRAANVVLKLLRQAVANAKNNFRLDESDLYISKIIVNEGPKLKRFMPRARGSAYEIQKKTSHIEIILDEIRGKFKSTESAKADRAPMENDESAGEFSGKRQDNILGKKKLKARAEKEKMALKTEKRTPRIFRRQTF